MARTSNRGGQDFTMNLVSNASMTTFPGNSLSNFTTLLPTTMSLPGDWQVALVEIAWPAMVQNVTVGEFTVSKKVPALPVEKYPKHHKHGLISMTVPSALTQIPNYSEPVTLCIKPGCYPSVDAIMKAIMKAALGKKDGQLNATPRTNDSFMSWKIDSVTRRLHVKSSAIAENEAFKIMAVSDDLKNILGTDVIIDCQSQIRHETEASDQIASGIAKVVKQVGRWPIDLNAGSHTMFLYCDLVQNETLGDTQTALLRSIPLKSITLAQTMGEVNHKSFTNLQWKRIVKPQFQSISLTLANEMGQKMPFLSCGRTNITLAFRPVPQY